MIQPNWPALVIALTLASAFFGAAVGGYTLAQAATAIALDIGSPFEALQIGEAAKTGAITGIVLGVFAGAAFGYTAGISIDRWLAQAESQQPPPRIERPDADE